MSCYSNRTTEHPLILEKSLTKSPFMCYTVIATEQNNNLKGLRRNMYYAIIIS